MTLARITATIDHLRGWKGKLACFVAGAVTALGFAPFYGWPVLFVTLPILFLMLDKARHWRSAALYGWAFGYGYCMAGTYWISNALRVDMAQFGWLIPISVLGLSLVMAVWFALFGALYGALRTTRTTHNLLRFAVLWALVEYARSWGAFGFSWNLIGSVSLASDRMAQLMSLVGPFGMGLFVVLLALLPVLWLKPDIGPKTRQNLFVSACLLVIAANLFGWQRVPEKAALTDTQLRLVQGNIAQSMKWTDEGRMHSANIYAELTRAPAKGKTPSVVVWPETALPFTLREGSLVPGQVGNLLPPGAVLITGAVRSTGMSAGYKVYNSIVAIDADGQWLDSYDKHQLVPIGEFVPLRSVLPIEKITPGGIDFSRGEGVRTVSVAHVPPYLPLVCYEVIFPRMAVGAVRPAWIVNATNDAWYGVSPGPFQHFDTARMRAIEQGLPVVRAANTGVSAVIDPYGRSVARLGLNERGILDQLLPAPLPSTIYQRAGEWLTLTILLLCWIVTYPPLFRRK